MDDNHEEYKKISRSKEYGEEFDTGFIDGTKLKSEFDFKYKEKDLDVKFLGRIMYNQLLNPFPHMVV